MFWNSNPQISFVSSLFFFGHTCRSHHGWEICGSLEYKRLDGEGSGCRRTHHHFHTPGGLISHDDHDHNWHQAGRRCRCWMCLPVSNGPDRREHKHIERDPEETRDIVALHRDNDHHALRVWKRRWTLRVSMMLMVMMSHQNYNDICRKGTKTLFWATFRWFTRFSINGICHFSVNFFVFRLCLKTKSVLKSLCNLPVEFLISKEVAMIFIFLKNKNVVFHCFWP